MKWILLISFWTADGLEAYGYEYAYRNECERVAHGWIQQAAQQTERRVVEIWCYAVKGFAK